MQSVIPITCPQEIRHGLHKDAEQFATPEDFLRETLLR